MRKAVFLDRDGTIIKEKNYISDPAQVELEERVVQGLSMMQDMGLMLVVVSNQSGVGRGLLTEQQVAAVDKRIRDLLEASGVKISAFYHCLHSPEENCNCRKPQPGLLLQAAQELDIDLESSFMIGDKCSDVEAGRRAGVAASILVLTGYGRREAGRCTCDFYSRDLLDAALWIRTRLLL